MTLQDLLLDCYRRLNFTATPAATVAIRLTHFLNDAHRRLLTSPGMEQLRDEILTVTTSAGVARLGLPPTVQQVHGITQTTAGFGTHRLRALALGDARRFFQDASSGTPEWYVPLTRQPVQYQPFTPTRLWVVSSGTDFGTVYVDGVTSGGRVSKPQPIGTVLSSTTPVQVGTIQDFIDVTRFQVQSPQTGIVRLLAEALEDPQADDDLPQGPGQIELARIEVGQLSASYLSIGLWPIPSAALTYQVDYARKIPTLVANSDVPLLPEDFHYLLGLMAVRREMAVADDTPRYKMMVAEEQEALRALRAFVLYPPDYRVRNNDPEAESGDGGSNLGGFFPAGRW